MRIDRRHGVPHSRRAQHGSEASQSHQRRTRETGGPQFVDVSEDDGDALRIPRPRGYATRYGVLVRRTEWSRILAQGYPEDRDAHRRSRLVWWHRRRWQWSLE